MKPSDTERRCKKTNLCDWVEGLKDWDLDKIGEDVVRFTKLDDNSRSKWLESSENGMKLAMQVVEKKTTPWPDACNVTYPLITTAAIQFQSRAYGAIIKGNKVVKGKVTGADPQNEKFKSAMRVSEHMNWQLLEEDEGWEPEFDGMLLALPIEGCEFKKSYYSSELGRNKSEWIRPIDFIVDNYTRSLDVAPRITHRLKFYPHEIDSKMRSELWRDVELNISSDDEEEEKLQTFYEQHTFLDLDGDGYKEPYIITVHEESKKVVRVVCGFYIDDVKWNENKTKILSVPRINMFTKYSFIPSPDGSYYDIGFGWLVGPLSDVVNTIINQLVDAGTLANRPMGMVADGVSIGSKRGRIEYEMGQFKRVKVSAGRSLKDSIFQFTFKEPSLVLFNMLGMLVEAAKQITSVQDILTGQPAPNEEKATTTMARIEQGLMVFTTIYKRIFRGLNQEFKKLHKLNRIFLNPEQYFTILDSREGAVVFQKDYKGDPNDVQPVADPQMATTMLAFIKNQQLMQIIGHPITDDEDILMRFLQSLDIPHPETAIVPKKARQKAPDPELMLKLQAEASKHEERKMKMLKDYADAMKKFAEAESIEDGKQWQQYMNMLQIAMGVIGEQGNGNPQNGPGGISGLPQGGAGAMPNGIPGIPQPGGPGPS